MKRYSNNSLLAFVIIAFAASTAFAQSTNISGVVKESGSEEPLAGVNIIVKGLVIGTITELDGTFNLKVNQAPPLSLVFFFCWI